MPETVRLPLLNIESTVFETGLAPHDGYGCWSVGYCTKLRPVFVEPGDRIMVLRAMEAFAPPENPQTIRIGVNETELETIQLGPGLHDYRVTIPGALLHLGQNQVTLNYGQIFQPYRLDPGSMDSRSLAVKFRDILFAHPEASLEPSDYPDASPGPTAIPGVGFRIPIPAVLSIELAGMKQVRLQADFSLDNGASACGLIVTEGGTIRHRAWLGDLRESIDLTVNAGNALPQMVEFFIGSPANQSTGQVILDRLSCGLKAECHPRVEDDRPRNLVLITLDTLRQDHLGAYGQSTLKTPFLDCMARHGCQWFEAYSHVPLTGPAHASILTGLLPHATGVLSNQHNLGVSAMTMARLLRANGFRTAGFVSTAVLNSTYGYRRGFSYFRDCDSPRGFFEAEQTNEHVREYLQRLDPRERFFLWVHYYDPHTPYSPPGVKGDPLTALLDGAVTATWNIADGRRHSSTFNVPPGESILTLSTASGNGCFVQWMDLKPQPIGMVKGDGWELLDSEFLGSVWFAREQAEIVVHNPFTSSAAVTFTILAADNPGRDTLAARYAGEVEYLDRQLAELYTLFLERDLTDGTLFAVTADHGESLGEHSLMGHIHQLYEPLLRVPLILFGDRVEIHCESQTVRHVDLLPTLLGRLLVEAPFGMDGSDLAHANAAALPVYAETFAIEAREEIRSLRSDSFHYLWYPTGVGRAELFNLAEDPAETHPLSLDHPMVKILDSNLRRFMPAGELVSPAEPLTPEREAMLRSLGYL
ncbi:sulfatase [bacterium]|nr:sulfatase [candidate division CSSED10-310 bacterium]